MNNMIDEFLDSNELRTKNNTLDESLKTMYACIFIRNKWKDVLTENKESSKAILITPQQKSHGNL